MYKTLTKHYELGINRGLRYETGTVDNGLGIKHDSGLNKRTLGVNNIHFQCYVHRQHLLDMLCNLAYMKNVSRSTTLNLLISNAGHTLDCLQTSFVNFEGFF